MENKNNSSCLHAHVPNISLVLDCAELSNLAYKVESINDEHMINNNEVTLHFHARTGLDTEVMVITAATPKCIYVVFRGIKGVKVWLQNSFNTGGRYGPSYIHRDNNRVHSVFNEALFSEELPDRILNVVTYLRAENPDYHVVITGHNFGAALSVLFGVYVAVLKPDFFVLVVNFACPKVASRSFQKDINELPNIAIWRFVVENDAVCYYPRRDFYHVGYVVQLYSYKSNSEALEKAQRKCEGEDYSIFHYIDRLENMEQHRLFDVYYEDYIRRKDGCNIWQCLIDGVSY